MRLFLPVIGAHNARNAMGAVKAINASRLALRGTGRHRVSGVYREVDQQLLDLTAIAEDRSQLALGASCKLDILADHAHQHRVQGFDDSVQINGVKRGIRAV